MNYSLIFNQFAIKSTDVKMSNNFTAETTVTIFNFISEMKEAVTKTRGRSNLTKSASRGAHSPVRGHPRGSKFVPLNSWGRVSY